MNKLIGFMLLFLTLLAFTSIILESRGFDKGLKTHVLNGDYRLLEALK